jgi:hypothetical protein
MLNAINRHIHPNRPEPLIPRNHQIMLWWAGLRGAIAFALSYDVSGVSGPAIRTTTLVVCVVSIMLLGGTTQYALFKLNIRVGVGAALEGAEADWTDPDEPTDSSESEVDEIVSGGAINSTITTSGGLRRNLSASSSSSEEDSMGGSTEDLRNDQEEGWISASLEETSHWFLSFDSRWLKPLFTRRKGGGGGHHHPRKGGSGSGSRRGGGGGGSGSGSGGGTADVVGLLGKHGRYSKKGSSSTGRKGGKYHASPTDTPREPVSSSSTAASSTALVGSVASRSKRGFGIVESSYSPTSPLSAPLVSSSATHSSSSSSAHQARSGNAEASSSHGRHEQRNNQPSNLASGLSSAFSTFRVWNDKGAEENDSNEDFINLDGNAWTRK